MKAEENQTVYLAKRKEPFTQGSVLVQLTFSNSFQKLQLVDEIEIKRSLYTLIIRTYV